MPRHLSVRRSHAATAIIGGGRLVRSLAYTGTALLALGIGSWTVQSDGYRDGPTRLSHVVGVVTPAP